ncbi:MAG: hypothetical protein M3373_11365, partial [Gemmatimonadota bacterium]|nr:hypothetical protein [Gemmatimonadota bacterium]
PIITAPALLDTDFTPAADLEANTSYRWAVTARLANGDTVRVASAATFVILSSNEPLRTLLFQNFPNPFPSATSATTCIWFDLREDGHVRVEIFDLRGSLVRTLVPGESISGYLPAGRYGRSGNPVTGGGCDPRLSWDGTARNGRTVPAGVYLVRLVADGRSLTRKLLFRGR